MLPIKFIIFNVLSLFALFCGGVLKSLNVISCIQNTYETKIVIYILTYILHNTCILINNGL